MDYRLTMTQEQLDFWHALLAPFQDHELSEGVSQVCPGFCGFPGARTTNHSSGRPEKKS